MSTHATIFTLVDGEYQGIYVHSDGFMDSLGAILNTHYLNYEKVCELITHGSASYIDSNSSESGFYHEWRNEELVIYKSKHFNEFIDNYGEGFNYFFDQRLNKWICIQDKMMTVM